MVRAACGRHGIVRDCTDGARPLPIVSGKRECVRDAFQYIIRTDDCIPQSLIRTDDFSVLARVDTCFLR
jgi:hypothetical protein